MEKAKISLLQLYTLMVLFGLGSSSLLGLGASAKQDAWIAILIGNIAGMVLLLLYGYIFKNYPDSSFIETVELVLGKIIGRVIAFLYIIYLLYKATLVLRDIMELILLYVLTATHMLVVGILAMTVVLYAIFLGIETICRFSQIAFITVPMKMLYVFGAIASGITDFNHLKPVLENGWMPVLNATFPLISSFPFGEMVVFLMVFPYVNKKEKAIKTGILAIITVGIVLTLITIGNIITIGPLMIELAIFPTIQTAKMINIMDFIQRIEGLSVITFLTCSMTKTIVYAYAASIGLNVFFKSKNYRYYIIPVFLVILLGSIYTEYNMTVHLFVGLRLVPFFVNTPFEVIIPLLLITVIIIKNFFKKRNQY